MGFHAFNTSSNVVLRLIRKNKESEDNKTCDDLLAIECVNNNKYKVYYKDSNTLNSSKRIHESTLTSDVLNSYIDSLLFLLSKDTDPFATVQFNVPCAPVILLKVEELASSSMRKHILNILPMVSVTVTYKEDEYVDADEEDEEEEDEDEEEEDMDVEDEMPALETVNTNNRNNTMFSYWS